MKNTAKLPFEGLIASAGATASALAVKALLAAKTLGRANASARMLEIRGHAGMYGLLLPMRSRDS